MKILFLWTDILLWVLILGLLFFIRHCQTHPQLGEAWRQVFNRPLGILSSFILFVYLGIAMLDSIHFVTTGSMQSVFDWLMGGLSDNTEQTYSQPLAHTLYRKQIQRLPSGITVQYYPELKQINPTHPVSFLLFIGLLPGMLCTSLAFFLRHKIKYPMWAGCICGLIFIVGILVALGTNYHVLGTDQVGQDILYLTLKSIRTGLIIGTLTTLVMLPFAVLLGLVAGYFGGWIDDIIQYLYTTVSSIPGVLLIAASILALQVYLSSHANEMTTLAHRADLRLLALCFILGMTSWTSLCRILRAETLKLRELDYIAAARALGSNSWVIMTKHCLPNVMHLIIITVVLDFSVLVLAEAVLSYVGVGVDPTMISWGNMINSARLELAREPIVWWPMLAAFTGMFILVLAANLFADCVRDAFDPRY